ncbi:MAG: peptidyl-prolyl cis-trans isomerase [Bacteroidaceae bacterium]|nr:peptidyl-prolyl cis-trans isomerase [Bacteroidaceae bacterium]
MVVFLLISVLLLQFSCSEKSSTAEQGRTPVVSVDGNYLYYDELAKVMSPDLSPEDSAAFADSYIRNWISELLLYQNARRNIPDTREIDALVENYRRALIVHDYEQRMIEQKCRNEVNESDIQKFYDENGTLFIIEEPIVKGLFIKLPLSVPNLNKVRKWYADLSEQSLDELEKYCMVNAVKYYVLYDTWTSISQIESMMSLSSNSLRDEIAQNKKFEMKDDSFIYFVNVTDIRNRGEQEPLEKASVEIRRLLRNSSEVNFIERMKQELYESAIAKDRIVFFN